MYGDPLVHPQPESYWGNVNPVGPRGVYDEAKRFAEAMTMAYNRYHKLETRIVRIFNTYGERMRIEDGRAIPAFMSQALRGEDVTVFGDGKQTRSFCYVDDLVRGILALLMIESDRSVEQRTDRKFLHARQDDEASESIHNPVNIGNPSRADGVGNCQAVVIELTRSSSQITYHPLPADDPKVRRPDIQRARTLLQWEPNVPLEDALLRTIEYFRKVLA